MDIKLCSGKVASDRGWTVLFALLFVANCGQSTSRRLVYRGCSAGSTGRALHTLPQPTRRRALCKSGDGQEFPSQIECNTDRTVFETVTLYIRRF